MGIFPTVSRDENKTNIWNHHLVLAPSQVGFLPQIFWIIIQPV